MSNPQRVCVVGSGSRFFSGISVHTLRLANAMARRQRVSAILMRQLLPTSLYPGRRRVGSQLSRLKFDSAVRVFDGVDWYWLPSMLRALFFLLRERPHVLILQWWSGTVLHSYLALAIAARLLGARLFIEFHEVQDTGEERLFFARLYVKLLMPLLVRLAAGYTVHSGHDRPVLQQRYRLHDRPVAVVPVGSYDHYQSIESKRATVRDDAGPCNLLFFGIIRPFKGVEDLIAAFDAIPEAEINRYWLTVVGETWEGWTLPAERIARSRYRHRITFVNRYVSDDEVAAFFNDADAVVLPYHRSSASGPLHVAMSHGLPVVVTSVGGLTEAAAPYQGAIMVPPRQPDALHSALRQVASMRGKHFADPHSWDHAAELYRDLFERAGEDGTRPRAA